MPMTNVLLVDDEELFVRGTRLQLEKRDCCVLTATDGWEGLNVLRENRIDVVVLDIRMPGIDGLEVLRHMRVDFPLVEVLMLTGFATMEGVVEGLKWGAFDFIGKPCDISLLHQKIKDAHEKRSAMLTRIKKATMENRVGIR